MSKFKWLVIMMVVSGFVLTAGVVAMEVETGTVPPLVYAKDSVKVAVVQMVIPDDFWKDHSVVEAFVPWMDKAKADNVDLLVFPEYLLGAFKMDQPVIKELCDAVAERKLNVILGGWEYLPEFPITHPPVPKTYANTLLVIDRQGEIVGTYRKMHAAIGGSSPYCWPPEPNELGEWEMVWGEEHPVIDLDFGRIGLLTCYDGYFFPSFEIPSLKGAEVLVWVNARAGTIEEHICKAAAFMTCTAVVASNQSVGAGAQVVVYPGQTLAIAPEPKESYITAVIDLAELRKQRKNNRMLHQRRPGQYRDLIKAWEPWNAYPDIPFYAHPEPETESEQEKSAE